MVLAQLASASEYGLGDQRLKDHNIRIDTLLILGCENAPL